MYNFASNLIIVNVLFKRPLPSWYDDAKVGIFMHFGVYAVPGKKTKFHTGFIIGVGMSWQTG
jgi:hypothetical protein